MPSAFCANGCLLSAPSSIKGDRREFFYKFRHNKMRLGWMNASAEAVMRTGKEGDKEAQIHERKVTRITAEWTKISFSKPVLIRRFTTCHFDSKTKEVSTMRNTSDQIQIFELQSSQFKYRWLLQVLFLNSLWLWLLFLMSLAQSALFFDLLFIYDSSCVVLRGNNYCFSFVQLVAIMAFVRFTLTLTLPLPLMSADPLPPTRVQSISSAMLSVEFWPVCFSVEMRLLRAMKQLSQKGTTCTFGCQFDLTLCHFFSFISQTSNSRRNFSGAGACVATLNMMPAGQKGVVRITKDTTGEDVYEAHYTQVHSSSFLIFSHASSCWTDWC